MSLPFQPFQLYNVCESKNARPGQSPNQSPINSPHNQLKLMISKGEPEKLKQLCMGLKKGLSGETLVGTGLLSSTTTKPTKIGRTLKLRILSREDYKTKLSRNKGFPPELQEFAANGLGLRAIDTRLFKLKNLTVLDMTRNALEAINVKIYQMKLQVLSLADNQIKTLPDGLLNSPLSRTLQKLDLSKNKLTVVPKGLGRITQQKIAGNIIFYIK